MKNSFAPVFSNIVDSSLWSEPDYVCKVFVTLLALKEQDHVARVNAFAIGKKCWPADIKGAESRALDALARLQSPDTTRIEPQPHEGRRIQKVEGGYLILNGQYYEDMMRELSRKVYKARKEREYRMVKKNFKGVADGGAAKIAHAEDRDEVIPSERVSPEEDGR
jgi:hypothetical protein